MYLLKEKWGQIQSHIHIDFNENCPRDWKLKTAAVPLQKDWVLNKFVFQPVFSLQLDLTQLLKTLWLKHRTAHWSYQNWRAAWIIGILYYSIFCGCHVFSTGCFILKQIPRRWQEKQLHQQFCTKIVPARTTRERLLSFQDYPCKRCFLRQKTTMFLVI